MTLVFLADFILSILLLLLLLLLLHLFLCRSSRFIFVGSSILRRLFLLICIVFADMICLCDSCSSLSGIGAPFLYLWCMAGVTNFQLMRKFDEVNRRMDGQDETLKSIQLSLLELTSAVKTLVSTQDKKEVGYVPDRGEESDEHLHDDGESSSAIGKNRYITQLSKTEYEEKRMKNECLYCKEKYTEGHKCRGSKLLMLICPDPIMEESDNGDKISKFTPTPKPDVDIDLKEESLLPPVSNIASGVNVKQMLSSCEKTDCSKSEQGRGSDSEVRNQIGDMKEDKRGRRSEDTVTEPPVDHSHQKEYMCLFGKLQALKAQIQIQQKSRANRGEEIYTGLSEMRASLQSHPIIKC